MEQNENKKRREWPFHMTMTEQQKAAKQEKIDAANQEEAPDGLFAKVKYYLKRYWYIAVPAHAVSCTLWFASLYALVHSGVDIPSLLQTLHLPVWVIEKVNNTPPSAGVFVIALILYKVATPLRYITSLGLIQAIFWTLRRMGKLKTAREVEYRVRTDYEHMKNRMGRRTHQYRGKGVRAFTAQRHNGDAKGKEERK